MKEKISLEEANKAKSLISSKHICKGFSFIFLIYKDIPNQKDPFVLKNDIIFIPSLIKLTDITILCPESKIKGENDLRKFFSQQKKELGLKEFSSELKGKLSTCIKTGKGFIHNFYIEEKAYTFILKDWK
jgi:hypothetical protein